MMQPDYLMLGHFTRDVLPDGTTTPGGTSLYAALTAHRLGRNVGVVSAPAELPAGWPDSIQITFHHSPAPPTFENHYTPEGREQTLRTLRRIDLAHFSGRISAQDATSLLDEINQAIKPSLSRSRRSQKTGDYQLMFHR